MALKTFILALALPTLGVLSATAQKAEPNYKEKHRNQYHFSPLKNWMNDPNGMVYLDGEYHLFFQHDKYENVFGDMSWGHAVSKDLVHWKELPKAIVPDEDGLGLIFSGSAVLDKENRSGLGKDALVAFYTSTAPRQQQSMAYSTDKGRTWTKYKGNPVIKNLADDDIPEDFRDPKVTWYEQGKKWIMSVAAKDHVEFWSSTNLIDWKKESDFGKDKGSHNGVWECPDLIELPVNGDLNKKRWVLLLSINPGGPNGGSATQYFVGDFDGQYFTIDKTFEQQLYTPAVIPSGETIADFEDGYAGWKVSGNAFSTSPAKGTIGDQHPVSGFLGSSLINTFLNGDASVGKLTSSKFQIKKDYINLLVGGGSHSGKTAVNLIVDGKVVRTVTGNNSELLSWKNWNVKVLKGKLAQIEVVDNETGGWGHILVDNIMQADSLAKDSRHGIWIDYGSDNYAGVTWSNVNDRAIAIGWMNNWAYAGEVPSYPWRGAMTLPRTLGLKQINEKYFIASNPVAELEKKLVSSSKKLSNLKLNGNSNLSTMLGSFKPYSKLQFSIPALENFQIIFSNQAGNELIIGYDKSSNEYFVDRTRSSKVKFNDGFYRRHTAPRVAGSKSLNLSVWLDASSVELFADHGLTAMTEIYFADQPFDAISIKSGKTIFIEKIVYSPLKSIW